MDELLLNDETLTTRDIAYPARSGASSQASTIEPGDQPETHSEKILDVAGPLFPEDELQTFRSRWDHVQTSFVDEPRQAVEQADSLVANVVKRIAEQFSAEREKLEKQWDSGSEVSTEDLRQALKRYRSFFDRLLTL
jgi:hypothetical protein